MIDPIIDPRLFFWLLLRASLLSTTGLGNLPLLYDDLPTRGWATEREFAEAVAVSKISPGPTGLWVISLAYLVDGLRGALFATIAISLPPLLVLPLDRLYRRIGQHPLVQGFVQGLSLAVVGIFLVIFAGMLQEGGIDGGSLLILLATLLLGSIRGIPYALLLALAGLAGMLLYW